MFQANFTWIDPDVSDNNLFEVDDQLKHSITFFDNLEIHCAAECCGISAFSFDPADIKMASKDLDKNALIESLQAVIAELNKRKWWQRRVDPANDLRGKKISDIINYTEGLDKVLLELNDGRIITEVIVAPEGITVGLYVYTSISEVEKKFGINYRRLTSQL